MNPILDQIIEARNGHYCHVVEVSDVYELEAIADQIVSEFEDDHPMDNIIDFLESLEVHCLYDNNEDEVFNFSFKSICYETI